MSSELEIEFKNIVTQEEFTIIKTEFALKDSDFKEQDNYYFDTNSFSLKEKNCALRIRKKRDHFELTLKQPAQVGLLETTNHITEEDAKKMIDNKGIPEGEVLHTLRELIIPIEEITYFGTLTTNRAEIDYLDGLLVFDISSYLNKEDFEIEYEVKDSKIGETHFLDLMNRLNIPIRKTENKIVRFYKEKMLQYKGKE